MSDIVQRLREASQGREEWRIADPETGAYCMAFSHAGSPNPEREAREWLADHIARFPNSPNATKVVTHAIAHFLDDQMQIEAADLIEAQAERIRVLREALQNAIDASDAANAELAEKMIAQGITSFPISDLVAKAYEAAQALRGALEATK